MEETSRRVKYFPIHIVSQSVNMLLAIKDLAENNVSLIDSVFSRAMKNMSTEQEYFYCLIIPYWRNKTSYMRWSQVLMFLAFATLQEESARGKQEWH